MADDLDASRRRILEAASTLLEHEGVDALSTRSVAAAAGIRAASLYQLFEDKRGLLTALAVHAFDRYLAEKQQLAAGVDPVTDMRLGWDAHVAFGLRLPAHYLLMFGSDRPGRRPPASQEATEQLLGFLDRVAASGRLRVLPSQAAALLQSGVVGVTLALIAEPEETRDAGLSDRMREAVIAALVTDPPATVAASLPAKALALDAALAGEPETGVPLRPAETALLRDWLRRLALPCPDRVARPGADDID